MWLPEGLRKKYRFAKTYADRPYKKYYNCKYGKMTDGNEKLSSTYEGQEYTVTTTAHRLMNDVSRLRVNYEYVPVLKKEFDEGKINAQSYNCTGISLDMIYLGSFFAKQDCYGRVHSNLTNLKSEYRNFLTTDQGDKLVSIDIKNSQPFFTTLLLKSSFWSGDKTSEQDLLTIQDIKTKPSEILQQSEHIQSLIMFTKSVEDNDDVRLYRKLVLDGCLYEFLLDKLQENGIDCLNRKMAKEVVF